MRQCRHVGEYEMMTQTERRTYNAFLTAEWREQQIIDGQADAVEDTEPTTEEILRDFAESYSDW